MVSYAKCGNCKIHAGFYFASLMLVGQVKKNIDEIRQKYNVTKIIMTGHSLGAAMALIMGLELKFHYYPQIK